MLAVDIVLIISLLVFCVAWWGRGMNHRAVTLALSVIVALVASIFGVLDDRWQTAVGGAVAILFGLGLLINSMRGAKPRTGTPWITGPLYSLLVLIAIMTIYFFPITDLPSPSGKYPVGVRDFELADAARMGVYAAGANEPRRLLVRVWYPATDTEGLQPRAYYSDAEVDTTATVLGNFVGAPWAFKYIKHSMTNSYVDAPLVTPSGGMAQGLPVVIYSHGYTSFASQNTALMEELASHGYAVYSIQHTYDSAPTVFPNGDVANTDPKLIADMAAASEGPPELSESLKKAFGGETTQDRYEGAVENYNQMMEEGTRIAANSAQIWLEDRKFVLDRLEHGETPESVTEIVAASNFSNTGQIGMSFGGSTTGGFCMVDSRCAAGVNLDGGDYHFTPFAKNIPVPFMMFYSDYRVIAEMVGTTDPDNVHGFNDFSYERPEHSGQRDDVVRLTVQDVSHLGVSDFTLFIRTPVRNPLLGSIDAQAMIQIQNDFVLGFFDTHLRGMRAGFPEAQFAQHQDDVKRDTTAHVRDWWLGDHPEDESIQVTLQTSLGDIVIALYPERAPTSVANFLAYVDGGHYDGATLYRATSRKKGNAIGVIQGGLWGDSMGLSVEDLENLEPVFPPISHETTDDTGILNERGTLAYARLAPGSAAGEFFFNMSDNPGLNTGDTSRNPDGQGYATFGRVLQGLRVLEQIQALPTDAPTELEVVKGQLLTDQIVIETASRSGN